MGSYRNGLGSGATPPLSCPRPTGRAYQKRTKYRRIYRYLPFCFQDQSSEARIGSMGTGLREASVLQLPMTFR
jgi:hypothetical protein